MQDWTVVGRWLWLRVWRWRSETRRRKSKRTAWLTPSSSTGGQHLPSPIPITTTVNSLLSFILFWLNNVKETRVCHQHCRLANFRVAMNVKSGSGWNPAFKDRCNVITTIVILSRDRQDRPNYGSYFVMDHSYLFCHGSHSIRLHRIWLWIWSLMSPCDSAYRTMFGVQLCGQWFSKALSHKLMTRNKSSGLF